jgi:hypothetical protein
MRRNAKKTKNVLFSSRLRVIISLLNTELAPGVLSEVSRLQLQIKKPKWGTPVLSVHINVS